MNFKTIAILVSFGAICSSAAYAMEPSLEEQLRSFHAKSQELAEQRAKLNEHRKLISQVSEKNEAALEDVSTKVNALTLAVQNGTMSRQDAQRAKEALLQSHRNQTQACLEEVKQTFERK